MTPAVHAARSLIAALVLGAALTGCGVSTGKSSGASAGASSAPTPTPTGSPTATPSGSPGTGPSTDSSASGDSSDLGTPVGTRTAQRDGFSLELTVYPVTRDGAVSTTNFTLRATGGSATGSRFQLASLLADNDFDASDHSGDTVDGVRLVDGAHSKVYLVASDGSGHCLCSRDLSGTFLESGESTTFNATFAAPPSDVDTVTVSFPSFGSVSDVPVG